MLAGRDENTRVFVFDRTSVRSIRVRVRSFLLGASESEGLPYRLLMTDYAVDDTV